VLVFKDRYYIKSLVATLIVLSAFLAFLFCAIYITGLIGLAVLSISVVSFFVKFYWPHKDLSGKELSGLERMLKGVEERL
jgi:hypothetical protein